MRPGVLAVPFALTLLAGACTSDGGDRESASTSTTEGAGAAAPTRAVPTQARELCESLRSEPYEVRKADHEAFMADGAADTGGTCDQLLDRFESVLELETAVAEITDDWVETSIDCDESTFFPRLTNRGDRPLGIFGALSRYTEADEENRVGTGFVTWSLEPGTTYDTPSGNLRQGYDACGLSASAFLADGSDLDASVPGVEADGDQASDDPSVWFPALMEREREWITAADPAGVADTEDVRSREYPRLVSEAPEGPSPLDGRPVTHTVCEVHPGPTDGYVGLLYRSDLGPFSYEDDDGTAVDLPATQTTSFGAFRRGADGLWRWLGQSRRVANTGCLSPLDVLDQLEDLGIELPDGIEELDPAEREALIAELGGR